MYKIKFKYLLIICLFNLNLINSSNDLTQKDNIAKKMAIVKQDGSPMALDFTKLSQDTQDIIFEYLKGYELYRTINIKDSQENFFPHEIFFPYEIQQFENLFPNPNCAIVLLKDLQAQVFNSITDKSKESIVVDLAKLLIDHKEQIQNLILNKTNLVPDLAKLVALYCYEDPKKYSKFDEFYLRDLFHADNVNVKKALGNIKSTDENILVIPFRMYGQYCVRPNVIYISKNKKYVIRVFPRNDVLFIKDLLNSKNFKIDGQLNGICISPDEKSLAIVKPHNKIDILNLETFKTDKSIEFNFKGIRSLTISKNSKYLLAGFDNGNIVIWNIENGDIVARLVVSGGISSKLAISPNLEYIISGGDYESSFEKSEIIDHKIQLWVDQAQELRNSGPL